MLTGVVLPGGSATEQLEQAVLAEQAGWDGVFVWEAAYGVDAWSLLAAMAARTGRVRLGTLLTPLPWRRPWKVASQVATVDQLSGGRAILGWRAELLRGLLPVRHRARRPHQSGPAGSGPHSGLGGRRLAPAEVDAPGAAL